MKHIKKFQDFVNESKGTSEPVNEETINYSFTTDRKLLDNIKKNGVEDPSEFIEFLRGTMEDELNDNPEHWLPVVLKHELGDKKNLEKWIKEYLRDVQGK